MANLKFRTIIHFSLTLIARINIGLTIIKNEDPCLFTNLKNEGSSQDSKRSIILDIIHLEEGFKYLNPSTYTGEKLNLYLHTSMTN